MHFSTRQRGWARAERRSTRFGGRQRARQVTGGVRCEVRPSADSRYALATGEAAAYRLHVLQNVYGPGTRRLLLDAGLRRGMRVADLGCGVGMVTALLSEIVGPEGEVVGVDI